MVTAKDLTANVDFILSHNPLYELTIDGKTYHYHNKHASVENDPVNLADLGMGYSSRQVVYSVTPATAPDGTIDLDPSKKDTATGVLNAYQRPYSIVFSETLPSYRVAGVPEFSFNPECKANLSTQERHLQRVLYPKKVHSIIKLPLVLMMTYSPQKAQAVSQASIV